MGEEENRRNKIGGFWEFHFSFFSILFKGVPRENFQRGKGLESKERTGGVVFGSSKKKKMSLKREEEST